MEIRLPTPCVVVLVGPSGSGKTHWARENFAAGQVVSSDALRGMVGDGEHDQKASKDAFELLDAIVDKRLRRRLVTVIDTLGLNDETRAGFLDVARRHGLPCHVVGFDTTPAVCRERNKARHRPVPARVLSSQIEKWRQVRSALAGEGFDGVHEPGRVVLVPPDLLHAPADAARQADDPMPLRFGLHISSFEAPAATEDIAPWLGSIAAAAEAAGFSGIWVMDHFLQIPQVGREWDAMLESYTTLAWLAALTRRVRLGVLVTGVTYRNPAHLAKIVATLDILSGGRAVCGLGAAWFAREHAAYGWEFPAARERLDLLEDVLALLPLMWGPGSPAFAGKVVSVPEATCYPRPIQDHIPILVGGGGERRTLRLVARYADACNLLGDPETVAHKLDVLGRHCTDLDRDPAEIEKTHLSTALVAADRDHLHRLLDDLRPRTASREAFAARVDAGLVADHVGRFRRLAEAGIQTAIVSLRDLRNADAVMRFAPVIDAFRLR